jgi:hypothetical protein
MNGFSKTESAPAMIASHHLSGQISSPPTADSRALLSTRLQTFGLCAGASLAGLAAVLVFAGAPRDPADIAAVFPPWWSQAQALNAAASAGQIQRTGGLPAIVVTHGDPRTLADRLRRAGAVLLLDPVGVGLCAPQKVSSR